MSGVAATRMKDLFERRRRLIAGFNQVKSQRYAEHARMLRDTYLGTFWGWFMFPKGWVADKIQESQTLAEAYALAARMLMGTQDS